MIRLQGYVSPVHGMYMNGRLNIGRKVQVEWDGPELCIRG